MDNFVETAIADAHRYSVVLTVYDDRIGEPALAAGILISFPTALKLVTAGHVVKHLLSLGGNGRLQLGTDGFTYESIPGHCITISRSHDLAAVTIHPSDSDRIGTDLLPFTRVAKLPVLESQWVAFVGYPGDWKHLKQKAWGSMGSMEVVGPVRTAESDQFSILVDPSYKVGLKTTHPNFTLQTTRSLGGISGAPVFAAGDPPVLAGWVSQGHIWTHKEFKVYASHATYLPDISG
jgi:hypothetical protein